MLLAVMVSVVILLLISNDKNRKKNDYHLLFIPPEPEIVKFWILIPDDKGAEQYNLNSQQIKNWTIALKAANRRSIKSKALLACSAYIQTENSLYTYYLATDEFGAKINVNNPSFYDYTLMDDAGNVYCWGLSGIE